MKKEPLVTSSQRQYLRDKVFELSAACPFDHENPHECPLHPVRKMSLMERCKWLDELTNPQMLEVFTYHHKCLLGK